MSLVNRIIYNIKNKGLSRTIRLILSEVEDTMFDIRFGTDTYAKVYLNKLNIKGENINSGVDYQPTRAKPLKKLLTTLKLPKENVFVDMGCGKGRVLLLACDYGFKEIIGIEFAAELCTIAQNNVQKYASKNDQACQPEIVHADVINYRFQDHETIFFLFNPFDMDVLQGIIAHINESINRVPRKVWLIFYHTPIAFEAMAKYPGTYQLEKHSISGNEFDLYIFNN